MKRQVFVNVYEVSKQWGGSEEGGWEYSAGTPVLTKVTTCSCDLEIMALDSMGCYECGEPEDGFNGLRPVLLGQHGEHCPAGHWSKVLQSQHDGRENWAESFTQAPNGESWLDSPDDVPEPFSGEVMRNGSYQVEVGTSPAESWPPVRPPSPSASGAERPPAHLHRYIPILYILYTSYKNHANLLE